MIAILVLAAILLILGESRDAYFVSVVVILNSALAIVQEVRAHVALKKLELMNAPRARRIQIDGSIKEVMFNELSVGDKIELQSGDEVPADGEVLESKGLEADESILTGESAPVEKHNKSVVYAASTIVAGSAVVRVTAVDSKTKAGVMTKTLKRYIPRLTPTQRAISHAITWLTYGALGLAIIIFVVYYFSGENAIRIFKTITAAAVVVVPEGLLLASSLLLAFGSLKLAQAKVLPQKLAAIEAMALLDVLCVDKTGTLTSDKVKYEKFESFGKFDERTLELISIVARETSGSSLTGKAIIDGIPVKRDYKIIETLSFSSERKISGVKVAYRGKIYSILLGAPEFLSKLAPLSAEQNQQIETLASNGKRVLLFAMFDDINMSIKDLHDKSGRAVGVVVLSNELRQGVKKTVDFLQRNGVSLRVISGDNPNTVRYIAEQAGIINHHKVITGNELARLKKADWDQVVAGTTIFARVLPEQKERLIQTFRRLGYYTGMVGDGVNDALALKKADLGIAMYAGAVATRRVADIVILDNSFNSLPMGMRLGNRIMQAIEMIAALFFHKIIFGIVLLVATLTIGIVYPFAPRHITFMNIFLVTSPTIMWTIFAPLPRHRLRPDYFWRDTLMAIAPIAALSGAAVTVIYTALTMMYRYDPAGVSTTTVLIATFFGIYMVFLVPRMFDVRNNREAQLARILYILVVVLFVIPSFGIGFIRDFFDFTTPAWRNTWPLLVVITGIAFAQWRIAGNVGKLLRKRERDSLTRS
jgi:cation-transporting ATPase E